MSKFRRQLMMASMGEPVPPGPILPYDAEVEWLGYNGFQYIDTGITPNETIEVEIKIMPTNSHVGSYGLFSMRNSTVNTSNTSLFPLAIWSNGTNVALTDHYYDSGWLNEFTYGTEYVLKMESRQLYKNNALVSSSGKTDSFSFDVTYGLLRNHLLNGKWDTRQGTSGRLYYCKVWKNELMVRDYISVRVNQVGCLYDRVSEQLFYNIGTGSFTYGNDVNS